LQIPSIFSTILLGGYSDHAGRKAAIIPPIIGAACRLMVFMFAFALNLHPAYLLISSVIDGIGGGTSTMLMACSAYISDVTDSQNRSMRIVIFQVCAGIALSASLIGLGYAIEILGYMWTFVILVGVLLLSLIYTVFILPETINRPPEDQSVTFFNAKHFTRLLTLFVTNNEDHVTKRHWKLHFALVVVFLVSAVSMGRNDVQTLFMLAPPLCFTSIWIGYFYAVAYIITNMFMLVFTRLVVKRMGDLWPVVIGLLSGAGYMLMFSLATSRIELFLCE
jgi:MFS family permease